MKVLDLRTAEKYANRVEGQELLYPLRKVVVDDAESVHKLVQETIRTVYSDYYEPAIVDGFCRLHNLDAIASDIELGKVLVLESGGCVVATGTLDGEHITRVFVLKNTKIVWTYRDTAPSTAQRNRKTPSMKTATRVCTLA